MSPDSRPAVARAAGAVVFAIPAGVARDQPPQPPNEEMHQGTPNWGEQYHIVIALFDNKTTNSVEKEKKMVIELESEEAR